MQILSIVCLFFYLGGSWGQEQVYVVSAPKVFYLGTSENVVIQAHGYSESFSVIIAIKSYPDKSFTYSFDQVDLSPENEFQNSANLTIQPKDLSGGPNTASHVYLEVISMHFLKETKIPLRYDNGFLFIQTDRSVYNLDQSVKVRVYSLDKDLKPFPREVTLTFINPEGSEVVTVEGKSHTGIVTFPDFKILSNPNYGVWTIKAKYKEDFTTTGTTSFEVKSSGGRFFTKTKKDEVKHGLPSYTLDLVATPCSLKPGIPYFIKVQVKDNFARFVGGTPVILKAKMIDKTQNKRDLDPRTSTTNHGGIASFMLDIPTDVTALEFHLSASFPNFPDMAATLKKSPACFPLSSSPKLLRSGFCPYESTESEGAACQDHQIFFILIFLAFSETFSTTDYFFKQSIMVFIFPCFFSFHSFILHSLHFEPAVPVYLLRGWGWIFQGSTQTFLSSQVTHS